MQLRIPAAVRGQEATLPGCLEQYFAAEMPNGFACEKCGKKDLTSKQELVKEWGNYLVLNCDRAWKMGQKIGTKIPIPTHVSLEKHMADYEPLAADASDSEKKEREFFPPHNFEVIAFAEHQGTRTNAGHYFVTRKVGNKWYRCNDKDVSQKDEHKDFKATKTTLILLKRE